MRVLVTGGPGYISSVLVEELLRGDHQVTVYPECLNLHRYQNPSIVRVYRRREAPFINFTASSRTTAYGKLVNDSNIQ